MLVTTAQARAMAIESIAPYNSYDWPTTGLCIAKQSLSWVGLNIVDKG